MWEAAHDGKVAHATKEEADKHRDSIAAEKVRCTYVVYPCTWEDKYEWGRTAQLHYHVGRPKDHR